VQSVAEWIKDFDVEGKVKGMIDAMNIESTQEYEVKVKEVIFRKIRKAVMEMYTSTRRG
jgi:hypothetical protein